MTKETDDIGVIEAVLERLNEARIPRMLEMKERLDSGELLTDYDMEMLERVLDDNRSIQPLVHRHPEIQLVYAKATDLYHDITSKGLENQEKIGGKS